MKYTAFGRTDVGRNRPHNEDYLVIEPELGLYLVCDGMGGHACGEVASRTAAESVRDFIARHRDTIEKFDDSIAARKELTALVNSSIQKACSDVYHLARSSVGRAGMGTTLTMFLVVGSKGCMGHVGDSRFYLYRNQQMHQLSEDHTYGNELVKNGVVSAADIANTPIANTLVRSVGTHESTQPDLLLFDIMADDRYLLCSDGLTRHIATTEELGRFVGSSNLPSICDQLINTTNERGGRDNITAVLFQADIDEATSVVDRACSTQASMRLNALRYVSLFQHMSMKELCLTVNAFRTVEAAPSTDIIQEGEWGDSLYVVLDGSVGVYRRGRQLATLKAGTHFGEMALVRDTKRSASVKALEQTRLLSLQRDSFNALIRKDPNIAVKILWSFAQVLATRLDDTNEFSRM